jgi:uncharacterized membrane protein
MSESFSKLVIALIAAAAAPARGQSHDDATFYGFPNFGAAVGVSDGGRVLIQQANGFVWSIAEGLAPINASYGAWRISGDGQWMAGTGVSHAYRLRIPSGPYATLPASAGGYNPQARGISQDGSVVVGAESSPNGPRPWWWSATTGSESLPIDGPGSAEDVSANGQIVVGLIAHRPFVKTSGTLAILPRFADYEETEFRRISRDGTVAVGDAYSIVNGVRAGAAIRWTSSSGYESLGRVGPGPNPFDQVCYATACNRDGSLVGGSQGGRRAWIWDRANGIRDLQGALAADFGINLPGWSLEHVLDISSDGDYLVGSGIYFDSTGGHASSWVVHIHPRCFADCDRSTSPPVLNVLDFNCFLNEFAAGTSYANCDGSTVPPVLNVLDFNCFLNRFAAGCS